MLTSTVSAAFAVSALTRVDPGFEQYAATVGIAGLFVAFLYGLYRAGRRARGQYDENLVEILQAFAVTVGAIFSSLLVVRIWRLDSAIEDAYEQFTIAPETAILALVTFVALAVTYTLTRVTKRIVGYSSGRIQVTPHQREILHHAVQLILLFAVATFIFALWEFDPTNLLIGAGALGIVLGFAARQTLSGVLSGFVILFGRPFEVGDWIAVGEQEGIVTNITVYNTQLRTFNEEHVLVPNDTVTESEIINFSKTSRLRLTTDVGVDYDTDVSTAVDVAKAAMESCESVADAPKPDVVLESFADSAVVLRLRYWIDRPTIAQKLSARNEVVEAVKGAFEAEGIKIPYPQRELTSREEARGVQIATGVRAGSDGNTSDRRPTDSTAVSEPVEQRYSDGSETGDERVRRKDRQNDGSADAAPSEGGDQ